MTELAILLFLLTACVLAAGVRACLHLAVAEARASHRAAFFGLFEEFVADRATPDAALRHLEAYLHAMRDPRAFDVLYRRFAQMPTFRQINLRPQPPSQLSREQALRWSAMFLHWILALSYERPIRGFILRARLAEFLADRGRDDMPLDLAASLGFEARTA